MVTDDNNVPYLNLTNNEGGQLGSFQLVLSLSFMGCNNTDFIFKNDISILSTNLIKKKSNNIDEFKLLAGRETKSFGWLTWWQTKFSELSLISPGQMFSFQIQSG